MRLLLFLLAAPLFAGYTHSTKITITNHPSSTLTNFVLFVCANGAASTNCDSSAHSGLAIANLKTVGNGGAMTSATAYDSIIATTAACITKASFDMETGVYVASTGANIYRVLVASVSSSVDTVAGYLCWGDTTVTTYQGTTATWPSEYIGRWAFPNGSSLTVLDSTANANNGAVTGGMTAGLGQLDGAAADDGTGYVTVSSITTTGGTDATWSCWVNPHTTGGPLLVMGNITTNAPYVSRNSDNTIWSSHAAAADPIKTIETLPLDAWTMVTMTINSAIVTRPHRIYINGAEATYSDLGNQGLGLGIITTGIHIGAYFDNSFKFNGILDECLFTNDVKTLAWVAAKFANESAPYSYYTFGSDTPVGGIRHRMILQ